MIQLESLNKSYGNNHVLKNISTRFLPGSVYGIVGDNGAGKTTLFRCIVGLEDYEGKINSPFEKLKNHIGFLPTEPFMFTHITGKEYIRLLCMARNIDPGNIEERNIFDLPLNKFASTYSTGMKKKLSIMAILMQENDCLILDEPFNGVDIHSNIMIADIIHRLKDLKKTILISSHIFSTLKETCDEIFFLSEGVFAKNISRPDFDAFEKEYKAATLGNKIDTFGLK